MQLRNRYYIFSKKVQELKAINKVHMSHEVYSIIKLCLQHQCSSSQYQRHQRRNISPSRVQDLLIIYDTLVTFITNTIVRLCLPPSLILNSTPPYTPFPTTPRIFEQLVYCNLHYHPKNK